MVKELEEGKDVDQNSAGISERWAVHSPAPNGAQDIGVKWLLVGLSDWRNLTMGQERPRKKANVTEMWAKIVNWNGGNKSGERHETHCGSSLCIVGSRHLQPRETNPDKAELIVRGSAVNHFAIKILLKYHILWTDISFSPSSTYFCAGYRKVRR